jgi:Zc3h12a-like Ribonuclease NYN domain/S1 RNA binding domain
MHQDMKIAHVVVDGSNIATEGRDAPSLAQLDEAVQAFIEEYSPKHVTVVVDATFPNRIDRKERKTYEDAVNANELITPPAGAIGRGDAFILQIARRAGAAILSNDSFQEFHGDYPWLFEKGRLIGGKPVPHVGWVFMDRAPVRGPTSRRAVSEARKVAKATDGAAEQVAAEVSDAADAAPPPRKRRSRAKAAAAPPPTEAPAETMGDGEGADQAAMAKVAEEIVAEGAGRGKGGRLPEPYNEALPFIEFVAAHPVGSEVDASIERFSSHGAYVLVGSARAYIPLRNLGDPAPRSAKEVLRVGEDRRFVVVAIDTPRRGIDLALPGVVDVPAPDLASTADLAAELAVDATDASAAPVAGEAEPKPARARKAAKAPAKKASAKKTAAKKTAAKQTPAKKAAAKKAPAKKAPAKKAAAKKAAAKHAPAEKSAGKKAATKKSPAENAPAKRTATKKTAAKRTGATSGSTRKAAATPAEVTPAGDVADVTPGDPAPVSSDGDTPPAPSRRSAATKAARSSTAARATKAAKGAKAASATTSPTPVAARPRRTATKAVTGAEVVPLASGADASPEAAQG